MLTSNLKPEPLSEIELKVLRGLNEFLNETERRPPGFRLRLNFFKISSNTFRPGLISENGITGMIQASDQASVDQVLPFRGGIADTMCDNSNSAGLTYLAPVYSDLLCFINRKGQSSYWICKVLETLT